MYASPTKSTGITGNADVSMHDCTIVHAHMLTHNCTCACMCMRVCPVRLLIWSACAPSTCHKVVVRHGIMLL